MNEIIRVNRLLCQEVAKVMEEGKMLVSVLMGIGREELTSIGNGACLKREKIVYVGYRKTHYAMKMIAKLDKLVSVEFAEVNPLLD